MFSKKASWLIGLQCLTWGKIRRHYSSRCRDKEISEASHVSTEQVAICQFPLRKMNIKICHFHQYYDLSFSIWHESWNSVIKLLYSYNCCCLCQYFCCSFLSLSLSLHFSFLLSLSFYLLLSLLFSLWLSMLLSLSLKSKN